MVDLVHEIELGLGGAHVEGCVCVYEQLTAPFRILIVVVYSVAIKQISISFVEVASFYSISLGC